MISGDYKNKNYFWDDSTLKVEKSHRAYDKQEDKTDPIIVDIEEISEEESVTEESFPQDYAYNEYYYWNPNGDDDTLTMNQSGEIEITLTHVKRKIIGYNKKGKLEEEKPKPNTIKII